MHIDIDTMLELAERQARRVILEEHGQLMPTWCLIDKKGKTTIMGTPWANELERALAPVFLKVQMKKLGTVAYSFVSEAWVSRPPKGWEPGQPHIEPRKDPERSEGVVAFATDGVNRKMRRWLLKRDYHDLACELKLTGDADEFQSWMSELLIEVNPK